MLNTSPHQCQVFSLQNQGKLCLIEKNYQQYSTRKNKSAITERKLTITNQKVSGVLEELWSVL